MSQLSFKTNDPKLDPGAVNSLYTAAGWNDHGERTRDKTSRALALSLCHVTATYANTLVGFGRIIGDTYTAQILDLITHPDYRQQGIATEIMKRLLHFADGRFLGVTLIDGSGLGGFYERFGFEAADPSSDQLMYWAGRAERP